MSLARPTLFVHCRAHRRLRANTGGKIKRFSGCYYPRRYRLQLFRSATAVCSCTPRNLNRNHFWEKRFRWHNPSFGRRDRDDGEQTSSLDKTESPSKIFMCGVSTQNVNSCVLKHLFLERVEQPKISPKDPRNALSDALLMSCFQKFAGGKKNRGFFETALHAVSINELVH